MCMRPCGPVRHYTGGSTRLVTKKEIYELLSDKKLEVTLESNEGSNEYDGTMTNLKSAIRSITASVDQAGRSSKYYMDGYRTIIVKGSYLAPIIIMRMKR